MLLHTAERLKRSFSCFCTLQKGQKEIFHASAHCRKAKKRFLALKRRAEAWNSGFNFYMTIMLTGRQSAGGGSRLFLFVYPNF